MNSASQNYRQFKRHSVILLQGVLKESFFDGTLLEEAHDVFVLEGRPMLEAAKHNCKALQQRKMIPTLVSDNMAGFLFYKNLVREVWVACQDKVAGGFLCDVGAVTLGVLAKRHNVPFNLYPARRKTQLMGKPKDTLCFNGRPISSKRIQVYVPLVDCVEDKYISKVCEP